uniref:uncharacterized protein LOC120342238 n=1 Tax=Styela clava TaxID=7725 RepID=UPI001939B7C8|nr:uncharacterized protein LOC120342238 [Styela clava]XP_039266925.1 uncharacterized protein LOC120342238 [Styela clava]
MESLQSIVVCVLLIGILCNLSIKGRKCSITDQSENEPILVNNKYEDAITISRHEGFDGKCRWNFSPPDERTDLFLTINVTQTDCEDKFIIKDVDKCNETFPFKYTFYPTSCGLSCDDSKNCVKADYPLQITFDENKDNTAFALNYTFKHCFTKTEQTTEPAEITDSRTTKENEIESSPTVNAVPESQNSNYTSGTGSPPSHTTMGNSLDTTISPAMQLLSIFIPIVVILLIGIIFLLVVLKIRHKKIAVENRRRQGGTDVENTPKPNNVVGSSGYEQIDIDTNKQTGSSFGNQAYQTVIGESNQAGAYASIDDGAVFYSSVNEDSAKATGKRENRGPAYDQVAEDPNWTKDGDEVRHNYDDVALEPTNNGDNHDAKQPNEKQEVYNVIYSG